MLRSLLVALAVAMAWPNPASAQLYLRLETTDSRGVIEGDALMGPFPNGIEIDSFSQGSFVNVDPFTGQPRGKEFLPFEIVKAFDSASIDMMTSFARLSPVIDFRLEQQSFTQQGTFESLLRIELLNAVLLKYEITASEGDETTEKWTFAYDLVRWTNLLTGDVYEEQMGSTAVPDDFTEGLSRVASSPNPTSGPTEFSFRLPSAGPVAIDVYDFRGRHVATVFDGDARDTVGRVFWDGNDDGGRPVGTGIYLVKMSAGVWETSQKLAVVR